MLARMKSFLRTLLRPERFENEMQDEIEFHVEQHAKRLAESGVSAEEALRRARVEMGAIHAYKDDCREARGALPGAGGHGAIGRAGDVAGTGVGDIGDGRSTCLTQGKAKSHVRAFAGDLRG